MAADKVAVASGADLGEGLRQRPVAAQAPSAPRVVEPEDVKKSQPKVLRSPDTLILFL
jgi:dolichyl-phosphate-mannose-protein mannosyltransferase